MLVLKYRCRRLASCDQRFRVITGKRHILADTL
jgi:hypothetical protein